MRVCNPSSPQIRSTASAKPSASSPPTVRPHSWSSNSSLIQPWVVWITGRPAANASKSLFGETVSKTGIGLRTKRETCRASEPDNEFGFWHQVHETDVLKSPTCGLGFEFRPFLAVTYQDDSYVIDAPLSQQFCSIHQDVTVVRSADGAGKNRPFLFRITEGWRASPPVRPKSSLSAALGTTRTSATRHFSISQAAIHSESATTLFALWQKNRSILSKRPRIHFLSTNPSCLRPSEKRSLSSKTIGLRRNHLAAIPGIPTVNGPEEHNTTSAGRRTAYQHETAMNPRM